MEFDGNGWELMWHNLHWRHVAVCRNAVEVIRRVNTEFKWSVGRMPCGFALNEYENRSALLDVGLSACWAAEGYV